MKNESKLIILLLILSVIISAILTINNKSYSITCDYVDVDLVTNSNNTHNLIYYCISGSNKYQISNDDAINYYDKYHYMTGFGYYFHDGVEIDKDSYEYGRALEERDRVAASYGDAGIRVHSTQEFESKIDDIFNNLSIGDFYFVFSNKENVNVKEVITYLKNKYGVNDVNKNYYKYSLKGDFEPIREVYSDATIQSIQNNELFEFNTEAIFRINKSEKEKADNLVNQILPYLTGDGSDYQKILGTYNYIRTYFTYLTDNGFVNNLLASNTSLYDAVVERKSVCIGYSITFSYIMDKFGIDSYIVDVIDYADPSTGSYSSQHSYNLVKLDNKYYVVDTTGGVFLKAVYGLSDNNLSNLSTTDYQGGNSFNLDINSINNIYNNYNGSVTYDEITLPSTTTTSRVDITGTLIDNNTTKKSSSNTNTDNNTNSNNTSNRAEESSDTTSTTSSYKTVYITNEKGEKVVDENNNYVTITDNTNDTSNTTDNNIDNKSNNKTYSNIFVNIILICSAIILLVILIKIKLSKKKIK